MAETLKKHKNFVAEPMGDKPVTHLAGIGETLGARCIDAGFDKAFTVLGQYLLLKRDEKLFKEWLKDACKACSEQASDCCNCCLNHWCKEFL